MKTALVTGASRGIGKAIAEKLKADNYKVLGTATSDSGVDTLKNNCLLYTSPSPRDRG